MVATGTGETLPGPAACDVLLEHGVLYRVILGKWTTGWEGVGGGRITA
jgi:hypothetical protein